VAWAGAPVSVDYRDQEEAMSDKKPEFREDDSWFSEEQLAQLTPADLADRLHTPVPTQMVSNGEYMPFPKQRSSGKSSIESGFWPTVRPHSLGLRDASFSPRAAGWRRVFSR